MPPTAQLAPHRARAARILLAALVAATLAGCAGSDSGGDVTPPTTRFSSTWDRIQATVLTPSCAAGGCHQTGSAFAQASGLVLEKGVAYQNLVGVAPKNLSAHDDGLVRVKPSDPEGSFLYWKLRFLASPTGRDYGSPMPLSGQPLTNGEVEYIRRWIAAGAPQSGDVVDTAVLADHTRIDPTAFTPLAPPAQGVQLHIEPFSVAPNFEREIFVYKKLGNASDIYVNRIETKMRLGSHHFLIYTFRAGTPALVIPRPDVVRDIRNPDGSMNVINMIPMAYHVFFGGSMTPTSDYRFPDGVALRVPADAAVDLNSHYVNKGTTATTGEAYANLYTVDKSQVQREAFTLDMDNQDLTLPPHQRTTVTRTFTVSSAMTIFLLTSHMHARGERFVIRLKGGARDGEVVYDNSDWAHPVIASYAQPIVLQPGQGLTSEVTYNNDTDRTIKFGLTSDDEMDIIFGYYY